MTVPFVKIDAAALDRELLGEIPIELMVRHAFLPLARTGDGGLEVALADAGDVANIDAIEGLLDVPVHVRAASAADIEQALRYAGAGERIREDFRRGFVDHAEARVADEGITLASLATSDDPPIVRLLDTAIVNALERRASDVHIETREEAVWIKYRIDGVLYPAVDPIDLRHHDALISRKLATVLCGGSGGAAREVTEQEMLDLEREAFMSLCAEPKTQERMQHMLETNKPLRN